MDAKHAGFTLVEALLVLAFITITVTLAIPSFSQFSHNSQARTSAHLLLTSLSAARVHAITHGVPVTVCPAGSDFTCRSDGQWDDGWLIFRDPERKGQPRDPDAILRRVSPAGAGQGLGIRSDGSRRQVRFLPDGRSAGTNLTIRLCSRHPRVAGSAVIVSNSGRARSERLPQESPECGPAAGSAP